MSNFYLVDIQLLIKFLQYYFKLQNYKFFFNKKHFYLFLRFI